MKVMLDPIMSQRNPEAWAANDNCGSSLVPPRVFKPRSRPVTLKFILANTCRMPYRITNYLLGNHIRALTAFNFR